MPYKWDCLIVHNFRPARDRAASAENSSGAAGLAQGAAFYRVDKVIDACLEAVASISLEVFGGRTKRRMRPLFNGIQIRGNRLEGVSQSSQIGAEFGIHGRHRKTFKLTN
jgi:hypothetical protein